MASAAQIAANRQNAMRSTGPKTDAGKNNSSRNALAHGLTATQLLLSSEEQAEFDDMRDAMLGHCGPATGYEWILFEDTVRAHWLWTRAQCAHTAFVDAVIHAEQKADPKLTAAQALARIFTDDKHARRLRLLMRYVSAAERTFRTAMKELERVVTVRARIEAHERYAEKVRAQQQAEEIGFVSDIESEPCEPAASVSPVSANPARAFGESNTREITNAVIRWKQGLHATAPRVQWVYAESTRMFTIDWNDPQMFWLNVTNVVLVLVTIACTGIVGYAAVKEILVRLRARMPILLREPHLAHMPELGMTMADGGEPMPQQQRRKSSNFRKSR